MSLRTFLLIAAVVEAFFGIQFLLVPNLALAPLGVVLNPAGVMLARMFGAALITLAFLFWSVRDAAPSAALTAILRAAMIYYVVSAVPLALGVLGGLANGLGWVTFALHIFLGAGFWHFGFRK
ncbi:hypothetical protein BH10PSE11_BH10PSE11_11400 [soil metagenome]